MPGPARITIELEPPHSRRGRWVTQTRIEAGAPAIATPIVELPSAEGGRAGGLDATTFPPAYEPPRECTCLDGFCDADHANE